MQHDTFHVQKTKRCSVTENSMKPVSSVVFTVKKCS